MIEAYRRISALLLFLMLSAPYHNATALEVLTVCDSITQGFQRNSSGQAYGVLSPGNGRANFGGYQPRLNQLLDANIEPSTVYNWGIGGEKTNQTVSRINSVLNSRPADYILILCGANDVFNGISSNTTRDNIGIMIERSLSKGVIPVVGELTPFTSGSTDPRDRDIWANYNPKIRAIAAAKGVPLAYLYGKGNDYNASSWVSDMRKCWKGDPRVCSPAIPYNSGDGLHLSDFGYLVMAQIWFETLQDDYWRKNARFNIPALLLPLLLD